MDSLHCFIRVIMTRKQQSAGFLGLLILNFFLGPDPVTERREEASSDDQQKL